MVVQGCHRGHTSLAAPVSSSRAKSSSCTSAFHCEHALLEQALWDKNDIAVLDIKRLSVLSSESWSQVKDLTLLLATYRSDKADLLQVSKLVDATGFHDCLKHRRAAVEL